MFKVILVATDGSKAAKRATTLAIDLAKKYRARLVVLHTLLRDASATTLKSIARRGGLSKKQRDLLDTYEIRGNIGTASDLSSGTFRMIPPPLELLEPIGIQILSDVTAAAKKHGVKEPTTVLWGGEPSQAILELADREHADLIVLGTRGLGEVEGLLVGSVSSKVTAHASCAVTLVR